MININKIFGKILYKVYRSIINIKVKDENGV